MDCRKTGQLICRLRKEKGLTQKQLAEVLLLSPKTISKWECGSGCPDVSLLPQLAAVLGVGAEQLLQGQLQDSASNGGNMKKIRFYYCPLCGNVLTGTGEAEVICCGRKLAALPEQEMAGEHMAQVDDMDDEYYITLEHDMTKEHFIPFMAWAAYDRVMLVRMYPEQNAELRMPLPRRGNLYICCNQHGLFCKKLDYRKPR